MRFSSTLGLVTLTFVALRSGSKPIQVPGKAIQMAGFGRVSRGFLPVIGVHAKIRGVVYDQNSYRLAMLGHP